MLIHEEHTQRAINLVKSKEKIKTNIQFRKNDVVTAKFRSLYNWRRSDSQSCVPCICDTKQGKTCILTLNSADTHSTVIHI